jgi:hypothetical protein
VGDRPELDLSTFDAAAMTALGRLLRDQARPAASPAAVAARIVDVFQRSLLGPDGTPASRGVQLFAAAAPGDAWTSLAKAGAPEATVPSALVRAIDDPARDPPGFAAEVEGNVVALGGVFRDRSRFAVVLELRPEAAAALPPELPRLFSPIPIGVKLALLGSWPPVFA